MKLRIAMMAVSFLVTGCGPSSDQGSLARQNDKVARSAKLADAKSIPAPLNERLATLQQAAIAATIQCDKGYATIVGGLDLVQQGTMEKDRLSGAAKTGQTYCRTTVESLGRMAAPDDAPTPVKTAFAGAMSACQSAYDLKAQSLGQLTDMLDDGATVGSLERYRLTNESVRDGLLQCTFKLVGATTPSE